MPFFNYNRIGIYKSFVWYLTNPSIGRLAKLPTLKLNSLATSLISSWEKNAMEPAKCTGTVLISSQN
jgi:hypothetical protein